MKTNFSLLFYLKKPKTHLQGSVPIYLRITVDGKRAELSTNRECEPSSWSNKKGQSTGNKEASMVLNSYLDKLKADITAAHSILCRDNVMISAEAIKSKYLGKDETIHTICEAISIHNKNMKQLVGKNDYAEGTLRRFEVLERHVKDYLLTNYNGNDIDVRQIDYEFIDGFDFFLHASRDNGTNTASKHLKNLGKIVRICLKNKWITSDPFFCYKMKSKAVRREYLTRDELQQIADKEFTTNRLTQVRDFFLFSCYTGLSYADVQKLKLSDIGTGIDGEKWLFSYRKKTGTRVAVPLLPVAADILDKYCNNPYCLNSDRALPISSNQKMNEYLVEIATLTNIEKTLGNRIAKRTFATTVTLLNGVPIESVSKMMGHTNIRTTQLYAKILDEKVGKDMAPLRKIFAGKNPDRFGAEFLKAHKISDVV